MPFLLRVKTGSWLHRLDSFRKEQAAEVKEGRNTPSTYAAEPWRRWMGGKSDRRSQTRSKQ